MSNTKFPSCVLPRAAMDDGAELAGALLKRSPEADDASDWAGAAKRSAPNRSLAVDYSQKIKLKSEIY